MSEKGSPEVVGQLDLDTEKVLDPAYFKGQAIQCIKRGELKEAALNISIALSQQTGSPPDAELYCMRSRIYVKLGMLYLAYQDAEKAVIFRPNHPDGFICHGEIYMEAGCYEMALMFFGLAAELNPMMDITEELLSLVKRASVLGKRSRMIRNRVPWVGAGIGIIIGVSIVIADQLMGTAPFVAHPALMVLLVIVISLSGYGLAQAYLRYNKMQIAKRLSPPRSAITKAAAEEKKDDTIIEEAAANNEAALKNRIRYSKAQARQRFKKGKF